MSSKTVAIILFILAVVMVVLGAMVQALPPVITAVGFAVIGYHILRNGKL